MRAIKGKFSGGVQILVIQMVNYAYDNGECIEQ